MKRYNGGKTAPHGYYLSLNDGMLLQHGEESVLPGDGGKRYIRLAGWNVGILGPVFGLAFIIFLPLIGILGIFGLVAHKTGITSTNLGRKLFQPLLSG